LSHSTSTYLLVQVARISNPAPPRHADRSYWVNARGSPGTAKAAILPALPASVQQSAVYTLSLRRLGHRVSAKRAQSQATKDFRAWDNASHEELGGGRHALLAAGASYGGYGNRMYRGVKLAYRLSTSPFLSFKKVCFFLFSQRPGFAMSAICDSIFPAAWLA
jgi:hypothetical protein